MYNNFFTICSLFYIALLSVVYFRRKNIGTIETKLYSMLIITNLLNVLFALSCYFTIMAKDIFPFINDLISKTLLIIFFLWGLIFSIYTLLITSKNEEGFIKRIPQIKKISLIIIILTTIAVISLPLYYHNDTSAGFKVIYSYGPAANVIYASYGVFILLWIVRMFQNYSVIKSKKIIPIIIFIIMIVAGVLIQKINPGLLLTTSIGTYITVMMCFTIENPDMKLLNEIHKSKEISDSANEEKTLFLYNMTQDIRNITNNISTNTEYILESNNLEDIKEATRDINAKLSELSSMTNEILDVSKLDSSNIKIYNSKYNLKLIIKELVTTYSKKSQEKSIEFRTNIEHNIPELLYGDSINLKESLNIILDNSTKYTKTGFIEFNVNTIIKNDICRLIMTIEDSGKGIKSDEIHKLKLDSPSLEKANKLITLMNGTMIISSDFGVGTKVKIILDQKIATNESKELKKYDELLTNIKILVLNDSENGNKIIDKLLKNNNTDIKYLNNEKEILLELQSHEKYDLILFDESLNNSREKIIKKLSENSINKIPTIFLTKDNKYEYNDEYKELGFTDYLLKPLKKEDVLNKINKYIKK